jgi:DNA mismatch repair protein MutS
MYPPGVSCFNAEYIDKLLQNFSPSEVLIQNNKKMISRKILVMITLFRRLIYKKDYAFEILTKHFQTALKGFGIADLKEGSCVRSHFVLPVRNTTQ